MRGRRRRIACALLLLLAFSLITPFAARPILAELPANRPDPPAFIDEVARVSGPVIILSTARGAKETVPARHAARGAALILSYSLCALFYALRAFCARSPRRAPAHSLRAQIGHPHQGPPLVI